MKAVLLAGGIGRHMYPLTEGYPKPLLRVAGKPLIEYPIKGLESIGVSEYIVVVSDKRVEKYVEERLGLKASIIWQKGEELEGALSDASDYLGKEESFILAYSDIIAPPEMYIQLINAYNVRGAAAAFALVPTSDVETYGVAQVNFEIGKVIKVLEKPTPREALSSYALAGAYVLPARVAFEVKDGLKLPEAFSREVGRGETIPFIWSGDWVDVDYPWDILSANFMVLGRLSGVIISKEASVSSTAIIEGPVVIDREAVVDHYVVIKGPAYIGPETIVGKAAFIREYTSLEEKSIVGAFSEVKRSSLQPSSSTGSYVLLVDSVLGPEAIVEPRVTVMSKLEEGVDIHRMLPLQGLVKKYKKLGIYTAPKVRVKVASVLNPASLIHSDGSITSAIRRSVTT